MANFSRAAFPLSCCLLALALPLAAMAQQPSPPQHVPLPSSRPAQDADKPDGAKGPADVQNRLPGTMPVPEARPSPPTGPVSPEGRDKTSHAEQSSAPRQSVGRHNARNFTPRLNEETQRAAAACEQRLKQLGVAFEDQAPLSDPLGCSVPAPLSVSSLGAGISLEPPGVMNCATAEAAARFAQTVISPAAKDIYGAPLKAVANASAYVCRPRNGSGKLSEHAFGNALDMSRFVFDGGAAVDVAATSEPKAKEFLDRIRKAACGPFKTVLGPGSDADHATHFHVDLAQRRNLGTFCQ